MVKNGIKNKRLYKFIIIWLVLFVGVSVLVFTNTKTPLKAETNLYSEIAEWKDKYCLDYTAPSNYSDNGITIINNQDGTFTLSGTTTAVVTYEIPLTIPYAETYCHQIAPNNTNTSIIDSCGIGAQIFITRTSDNHLFGGYNDYGPSMYLRVTSANNTIDSTYQFPRMGYWGNSANVILTRKLDTVQANGILPSANHDKKAYLYIAQGVDVSNTTILPIVLNNLTYAQVNNASPTNSALITYEYFNLIIGPTPNTDVYYTATKPQAGYYIYQKVNAQLGINLLPAIRYTLTADTTEITKDSALTLESANIDILKLTAPNGHIYRVYYDNITSSNTKDSYFVDDNGTTTILQNADGSGLINSAGLDALILAFQHALTNNAVITTADHYIFNLCSYLYVFDTDFGYAKGVQEGSANYQPGRPGYNSIYDAGVDYGEQQKDLYYNSYYGGSDGVGGAGYTSIYNAGVEAGADISVNWVFKTMSAVGSFLSIEILPNITFGALIGIPFIITLAWFIIRQLRGGGGS